MVRAFYLSLSMKRNSIPHYCSFPFQAAQLPNPPAQTSAESNIDEAEISLTEPTPEKVPASYKQLVRINGGKVTLRTSNYYTSSGLLFYCNHSTMKALGVTVDKWLCTQLSAIEKVVLSKVTIPSDVPKSKEGSYVYKPLLLRDTLLIAVSRWCKFFKFDNNKGAYVLLDDFVPFEKGQYNVDIEVSHVYIGPHKGGQNFSLSLRITQIMYKEDDTTTIVLDDDILTQVLSSEPFEETVPEKKKKPGKRVKKAKCVTPSKVQKNVVKCSA